MSFEFFGGLTIPALHAKVRPAGWHYDPINELTAVFAFDRIVLDLLGAVVALFHGGEGVPSSKENLPSFAREATTDFRKADPR